MLSKEGFCKALQMIKEQESIDEQFSKALNLVGDGHFVFGAENKYLLALRDVLKEAVNDQYDYIDWWLYEAADDYDGMGSRLHHEVLSQRARSAV
jgi:exonuclease III